MRKSLVLTLMLSILVVLPIISACAGWNPNREKKRNTDVQVTIARFKKVDPSMKVFFDNAYGYAVFPSIGKGGYFLGGGYGKGQVYEQGNFIGYSRIINLTVGAQIGGQSYSEIIFFKDKASLNDFKVGNFEFAAQTSAVFVTHGASKDSHYDRGVAVFTMPKAGAMAEASIGGQKFTFEPK
jgi:lipid-binding SYLF domain-containing protein